MIDTMYISVIIKLIKQRKAVKPMKKTILLFTGTEALKKAHAILKCEASHLILSVSLDDRSRQIDIFELYAHYYKADFNTKSDDYTFQEISRSEAHEFLDRVNGVKEIQFGGF